MALLARRATRIAPKRLVFITSSISESDIRITNPSRVIPALAITTSAGPNFSSSSSKAFSTLALSETSHLITFKPEIGSPDLLVTTTVSPAA